jgi:hypothetical protein
LAGLRYQGLRPDALWLVDYDRVDASNLNRQILFRYADRGRLKCEALAEQAHALFPECTVTAIPERFHPQHLDRFTHSLRGVTPVVALLSDNWTSRVAAMDSGRARGIEAFLYAGTSFDTAKVRLFGAGVEGSWCLGCGAERARKRAEEEEATPSCSQLHDASMVLPNVVGAVEAVSLLGAWLRGDPIPLGGREVSLVSEPRVVDGSCMAPCGCARGAPEIGKLATAGAECAVLLGHPSNLGGGGLRVVGATAPGASHAALVLLPPGATATTGLGAEPAAAAILLQDGERCRVDGEAVEFRTEGFRPASQNAGASGCSFCFTPFSLSVEAWVCPQGHPLCADCADEGTCPHCGVGRD